MQPRAALCKVDSTPDSEKMKLARDLASAKWDGEKDTVGIAGAGLKWEAIAADRHTCTGRRCPMFSGCTYYEARKRIADVDVIVANHALLLASLGTKVLPDLRHPSHR